MRPLFRLQQTARTRAGFTLLEVLLTTLLASVVLVALWSLSDIYLKMFASGKRKIEETQLVRSLTAQLAKDVSQVIQLPEESVAATSVPFLRFPAEARPAAPPGSAAARAAVQKAPVPNPNPIPASANGLAPIVPTNVSQLLPAAPLTPVASARRSDQLIPRVGLFGTKQALRLIVLQADPRTTRGPASLEEILPVPGKPRTPLAPELRTIQYTYSPSHDSTAGSQQHPGGLVRREWAWETWAGFRAANLPSTGGGSPVSLLPVNESEWNEEDTLALEEGRDLYHVPQVVGLEFRYYDGQKWEIEWDSWERRRLPKLVEVLLKINTTRDEHQTKVSAELPEEIDAPLMEENASGNSTSSSPGRGHVYRRLIYLPFAEEPTGSDRDEQGSPLDAGLTDSSSSRSRSRSRQP